MFFGAGQREGKLKQFTPCFPSFLVTSVGRCCLGEREGKGAGACGGVWHWPDGESIECEWSSGMSGSVREC